MTDTEKKIKDYCIAGIKEVLDECNDIELLRLIHTLLFNSVIEE